MKFVGKTLIEYFIALKVFLAVIFFLTFIIVVMRLSSDFPPGVQTLLSLVGVVLIGLAGWSAVSRRGFNVKQTGLVGFLLSFATHWSLPIFHSVREMFFLLLLNSVIFSVIAILGAWLATKLKAN
jgi:hypothetical protein